MNAVIKIRLLLVLLTISFFVTAVTIRLTFDRQEVLLHDARQVEENLQAKEQIIRDFISNEKRMEQLRSITPANALHAEEIISYLTTQYHIYVYTYAGADLQFWSSDQVLPGEEQALSGTYGIVRTNNGWYHAVSHEEDGFSVLFLVLVKSDYPKTNDFLKNQFSRDLIHTDNLDIADYNDRSVYNIRNAAGQYLFSVKLNATLYDGFYTNLELLMWSLGFFLTIVLVHIFCDHLASLGKSWQAWLSVLLFGAALAGIRFAEMRSGWFASGFQIGLFDPRQYASSTLFPHLGGFLINILLFSWFTGYVFFIRSKLTLPPVFRTGIGAGLLFLFSVGCVYILSQLMAATFSNLISNSSINFDVTDLLNLNVYGWAGIFGLCLAMMSLLFVIGFFVSMFGTMIRDNHRLFSWYSYFVRKYGMAIVISILLLLSALAALKHTEFQQNKKREAQKLAIQKLEGIDDPNALALFFDLEKQIVKDSVVIGYFSNLNPLSSDLLNEHLKRVYFTGYLSKYDFSVATYDSRFRPVNASPAIQLSIYRDKVISGAIKVSENFYRGNSNFGNYEYFAQFPVNAGEEFLGVLLIDMKNRFLSQYTSYPEVLADNRLDQQQTESMSEYSYAFYRDGKLVNQTGKYIYPVEDSIYYPLENREFKQAGRSNGFAHMAYKPNSRTTIVLSKPDQSGWMQLASMSFFFLVFMSFFMVGYFIAWFITTLNDNDFSFRNLRWNYLILSNRTLYSTRIQMFVVVAVVLTLITAGLITYFSISNQFVGQQERTTLKHVWEIAKGLESRILKDNTDVEQDLYNEFEAVANANAMDLNLYDISGKLIYTTQPRIYDLRLISNYIHPRAFVHLNYYGRSQFVQQEYVGRLNYMTAYATIKNLDYEPIAFLGLPNFSSQREFDKNIGGLLNALINIYALVIMVLGLFAVFVANKVTAPLLMVQRSLAKTKIGNQNEPIFWKRNDEIGSLIKEYNLMIAELEQSAAKIMQSERESAWKEMAKQVAHEIKNPLTPLKLGIQQLERSWKDQDPGFEGRFHRFIESFIEQIDSLTRIASEFSDFAKMPDAKFAPVDLLEVIRNSASVFDHFSNVSITMDYSLEVENLMVEGDRDQLLRAFNNLIKNAIEAASNKRRCQIRIGVSKPDPATVLIELQDNGEGIRPEARIKLFEPNFTTKSSGTGLGLAFVKRAVESMGGRITYRTVISKGTVFYIRLPLI